jgi:N-acetylmuramoyl-L-alanine amidase
MVTSAWGKDVRVRARGALGVALGAIAFATAVTAADAPAPGGERQGSPAPAEARAEGAAPAGERFDSVVIDPGHGGEDRGAAGPGDLLEKDVVLAVARRVAERLREAGLRVVLTREEDVAVALQERTRIANEAGADLFVSIHANAAPSRVARGMETYFLSLDASDEAAVRVAARENEAFGGGVSAPGPSDPLSAILGDLTQSEHLADSDEFARLTHARLAAIDPVPSRGVKQAPFVVLMGVKMPAALVEIGFITNAKEAQGLASAERQSEIAQAIGDAVLEFGRRYDARRGASDPVAATKEGGS